MPICPSGHNSTATDFCDTCGLPIPAAAATPAGAPVAPEPLQPPAAVVCPNCGTPNVAEALFCEACGHDFIGATQLVEPAAVDTPDLEGAEPDAGTGSLDEPLSGGELVVEPATAVSPAAPPEPVDLAALPHSPTEPVPAPASPTPPRVEWVAELWIDPDWYAAQGSTDPLPSPGLPDIVPLVKDTNLIGRVSTSRNIYPEIDCELDTGCSRRHARLTTDGNRWWIEDLESANGTFVGAAAGPLPAMPIPRGKVELAPDQRIYVGAWTRIVVRHATDDEKAAFEGLS